MSTWMRRPSANEVRPGGDDAGVCLTVGTAVDSRAIHWRGVGAVRSVSRSVGLHRAPGGTKRVQNASTVIHRILLFFSAFFPSSRSFQCCQSLHHFMVLLYNLCYLTFPTASLESVLLDMLSQSHAIYFHSRFQKVSCCFLFVGYDPENPFSPLFSGKQKVMDMFSPSSLPIPSWPHS